MKRFLIVCVVFSMIASLCSCSYIGHGNTETEEPIELSEWAKKDLENSRRSPYAVDFDIPAFQITSEVKYISQDEKEQWREPLISMLSRLQIYDKFEYYEDHDNVVPGNTLVNAIYGSDGIALMDLNFDGAPEVVSWCDIGGSAGNTYFEVFDLYSGEQIGEFNTGYWLKPVFTYNEDGEKIQILGDKSVHYGEWAIYVDAEGQYKAFGQYNYGNNDIEHYFAQIGWYDEMSRCGSGVVYRYFHEYKEELKCYDGNMLVVTVDYGTLFFTGNTRESQVPSQEAIDYFADLLLQYKLVEGSQMQVFKWEEIEGYGEIAQEELAEKMADILISSTQQFIAPKSN